MKKVLIVGGYGYVGTHLIPLLKDGGYYVAIMDNLLSGANPIPYSEVVDEFIYCDIRDDYVLSVVPNFDTIVHLAAIVGEPACAIDKDFANDVNVWGTFNLLRYTEPDQQFIFASTSSVYGNRHGERVVETDILRPLNTYARTKALNEADVLKYFPNAIIVRPVTAFGYSEVMRLDVLVNTLIYEALTTGVIKLYEPHITRPIIYVKDYANILLEAVFGNMPAGIYNIGDNRLTMSKLELAAVISVLCDAKVIPIKETSLDLRDYDVSFDKLLSTGYKFKGNVLDMAVQEMKSNLPLLQAHHEEYYGTYRVNKFLEDGKGFKLTGAK